MSKRKNKDRAKALDAGRPSELSQPPAKVSSRKRALLAIEDDLILAQAGVGVLHLAFAEMTGHGQDGSALAQSLFFTARNIDAACKRIRTTLDREEESA